MCVTYTIRYWWLKPELEVASIGKLKYNFIEIRNLVDKSFCLAFET